jgi:hypothetical protein
MFFEPRNNDHGLPYNPFKACVVPRRQATPDPPVPRPV